MPGLRAQIGKHLGNIPFDRFVAETKLARNCLVRQVAAQSAQYMDFPIGHLNEHRPSEDVERRRLGNGPERADVVGAVDRAAHPAEKRPSVGRVDAECVPNAVECLRTEEHTSGLQSLNRISYSAFSLK